VLRFAGLVTALVGELVLLLHQRHLRFPRSRRRSSARRRAGCHC
jgi:hypothetical protein